MTSSAYENATHTNLHARRAPVVGSPRASPVVGSPRACTASRPTYSPNQTNPGGFKGAHPI
eukprot:4629960-Prymnesium_polylepis.1